MRDLLVHGGRVVTPEGVTDADILIRNGTIEAVAPGLTAPNGVEVVDATGKLVFPGLIDTQVHFREPGLTHKEDLASGSLAAVGGGVTTFFEMPNTKPPTTSPAALQDKLDRAEGRAWADHAFFMGATAENAEQLAEWERLPGCAGIKIFVGSSTGSLLVDEQEALERIFRSGRTPIAVHSENEQRLRERYADVQEGSPYRIHPEVRDVEAAVSSTKRLLDLAEKHERKLHVLHISTAEELDLLRERGLKGLVTAEATPNHLFLKAPDSYDVMGSLVQMNPPVRDQRHRDALREAINDGTIDVIGSDHAPHTLDEKQQPYPKSPSGIPGVQTTLPLLLLAVKEGWLPIERIPLLTAAAPASLYGIEKKGKIAPGFDGDLTIVDPDEAGPLPLEWLHSRAGYSPYLGLPLAGWPKTTILRGRIVYDDHAPVGDPDGAPAVLAS